MSSPVVYPSGEAPYVTTQKHSESRRSNSQNIARININTKGHRRASPSTASGKQQKRTTGRGVPSRGSVPRSSSQRPIRQSFNINVVAINKRYTGSTLGEPRSFKADCKSSSATSASGTSHIKRSTSTRTRSTDPNTWTNQSSHGSHSMSHQNKSSVVDSRGNWTTTSRSQSTKRSNYDVGGGEVTGGDLPAIVKYKNKKIFTGLNPGQTEVVKEIARTTDVRNDLYCLQKRKVAILSSLEQRMKAEKRTGGDSRQVLSKCPAYYSNVTNTSANFLPVEGSGHKHPSRKETIVNSQIMSSSSQSIRKLNAEKTTVSIHRTGSRHQASQNRNKPRVIQPKARGDDCWDTGVRDKKEWRRAKSVSTYSGGSQGSSAWEDDSRSQGSQGSRRIPVENRNILMNVSIPLRTSTREDKNKSNERWPLIENGQALERRVQQRLNEGEEDTGGVVRMSSGINKEWYNLDTIGTASAGGRHSGSRTLLGLVAPADSARSNQYESGFSSGSTTMRTQRSTKDNATTDNSSRKRSSYQPTLASQRETNSSQVSFMSKQPFTGRSQDGAESSRITARDASEKRQSENVSSARGINSNYNSGLNENLSPSQSVSSSTRHSPSRVKRSARRSESRPRQQLVSQYRSPYETNDIRVRPSPKRAVRKRKSVSQGRSNKQPTFEQNKSDVANVECDEINPDNSGMFASDEITVDFSYEGDKNSFTPQNSNREGIKHAQNERKTLLGGKVTTSALGSIQGAALIDKKTGMPLISLRSLVKILRRHEQQALLDMGDLNEDEDVEITNKSVQTFRSEEDSSNRVQQREAIKVRNVAEILASAQSPASNYTEPNSIDPANFFSGDYLLQSVDLQNSTNVNFSNASNGEQQFVYRICTSRGNQDSSSEDFSNSDQHVDQNNEQKPESVHEADRCLTRIIRPKGSSETPKPKNVHISDSTAEKSHLMQKAHETNAKQNVNQVESIVNRGQALITDCSFAFDLLDSRQETLFEPGDMNMCELKADHWWLNRRPCLQNNSSSDPRAEIESTRVYLHEIPKLSLANNTNEHTNVSTTPRHTNENRADQDALEADRTLGRKRVSCSLLDQTGDTQLQSSNKTDSDKGTKPKGDKPTQYYLGVDEQTQKIHVFCVQDDQPNAPPGSKGGSKRSQGRKSPGRGTKEGKGGTDSETEVATRSFMYTDRSSKNYMATSRKEATENNLQIAARECLSMESQKDVTKISIKSNTVVELEPSKMMAGDGPKFSSPTFINEPGPHDTIRTLNPTNDYTELTTDFITCTTGKSQEFVIPSAGRKREPERTAGTSSNSNKTALSTFNNQEISKQSEKVRNIDVSRKNKGLYNQEELRNKGGFHNDEKLCNEEGLHHLEIQQQQRHSIPPCSVMSHSRRKRSSTVKLDTPVLNTARPFVANWKQGSSSASIKQKQVIQPILVSSRDSLDTLKPKKVVSLPERKSKHGSHSGSRGIAGDHVAKKGDILSLTGAGTKGREGLERQQMLIGGGGGGVGKKKKKITTATVAHSQAGDNSVLIKYSSSRLVPSSVRNIKRKTSSPIRVERVAISPMKRRRSSLTTATTLTNPHPTSHPSPRSVGGSSMGKAAEAENNQAGDVQTSYLEQPTAEKQETTEMMNGKSKKVGYIAEQNSGNSPYSSSAMTEPVSNWELSRNHFQTHFQNQQHKQQQQQQSLSRPPPLDQMALRNKLALVEATQNKSAVEAKTLKKKLPPRGRRSGMDQSSGTDDEIFSLSVNVVKSGISAICDTIHKTSNHNGDMREQNEHYEVITREQRANSEQLENEEKESVTKLEGGQGGPNMREGTRSIQCQTSEALEGKVVAEIKQVQVQQEIDGVGDKKVTAADVMKKEPTRSQLKRKKTTSASCNCFSMRQHDASDISVAEEGDNGKKLVLIDQVMCCK